MRFTQKQKKVLESKFADHPYPNQSIVREVAKQVNLTIKQVREWAARRRKKIRGGKCDEAQSTCESTLYACFWEKVGLFMN